MAVTDADLVSRDQAVADLVDAAPAGAPKHLVNFIRPDRHFQVIPSVGIGGQGDAAEGKINAGGQAHRGHDNPKLAGLGQRLDHAGPSAVAQSAVVIRHPRLQHPSQAIADKFPLPGTQLERVWIRQVPGYIGCKNLGGAAARRKNQDRPQPLRECLGREPRPITANLRRDIVIEHPGVHLLKRHRPVVVPHPLRVTAQALQPCNDMARVGHAAAEQQQLGLGRCHGDGQLVVESPFGVAQHLVLIDHQQLGTIAVEEAVFLRLQRGDDDRRVEVLRQIAGGDSDVPAARPPLGEFVIRQGAGRHGVDRLTGVAAVIGPQLKNEGFAGASGRVNNHIPAGPQMLHGLLLPQVRHNNLVQSGKTIQLLPKLPHTAGLANHGKKTRNWVKKTGNIRFW